MGLNTLDALYRRELRELMDVETQLTQLLPRMAQAAHDDELKKQFTAHGELSRVHRERLESIIDDSDGEAGDVRSEGMLGLTREAERLLQATDADETVRDAALLALAQKCEHYEMAGYGTLRTYAEILGEDEARAVLQKTLDEEGAADDRLTRIARKSVNPSARA